MTALPAASTWTGAAVTEGGFKGAQNDLRAFLAGLLGADGTVATALATLGSLLGAGVAAKSSNYTVVAGDRGKLLSCSGSITIALLAAASAGAGFSVVIKNAGSGTITVDGNLTETIDGSETITLGASGSALLICDGSGWITLGRTADTKSAADDSVSLATTAFVQAVIAATPQTEVAILSGTIAHGGTIPLPSGYTEGQCKWMVSSNNLQLVKEESLVSASGTRTVTCYARRWDSEGSTWEYTYHTANYIIIGVK